MKKNIPEEKRPRFGFCWNLDAEPQVIRETAGLGDKVHGREKRAAVVVIPLPFMSAKMKARVEKFVREELP